MEEDIKKIIEIVLETQNDLQKLKSQMTSIQMRSEQTNIKLEKFDNKMEDILNTLDSLAGGTDHNAVEQGALANQVDRLQKWIKHLSKETKISLPS